MLLLEEEEQEPFPAEVHRLAQDRKFQLTGLGSGDCSSFRADSSTAEDDDDAPGTSYGSGVDKSSLWWSLQRMR